MAKEILIADSDEATQGVFKRIFEDTDYRLIFSKKGEDVLLRAKMIRPDLIVAATDLSPRSGFEVCEAIKADSKFKDTPVILLANAFEEISEGDRERIQADGVISRNLDEDDVLNLADRLIEMKRRRRREEDVVEGEREWNAFRETGRAGLGGKGGLSPENAEEADEDEIIELVDVVEEPEAKMRITDLAVAEKGEPLSEIPPLGEWEKTEEMVKVAAKRPLEPREGKPEEPKESVPPLKKEFAPRAVPPEEDLFEKIDMKDVLQQVEQLEAVTKEQLVSEGEVRTPEAPRLQAEEPPAKALGLEEFEIPAQVGAEAELEGEQLPPLSIVEPEVTGEIESLELAIEEEELKELPEEEVSEEEGLNELMEEELSEEELAELPEEEFPEALLEEVLSEEEVRGAEEAAEEEVRGTAEPQREELGRIGEIQREEIAALLEPKEEVQRLEEIEAPEEEHLEEAVETPEERFLEEEKEPSERKFLDLEEFEEALKMTAETKPVEKAPPPLPVEEAKKSFERELQEAAGMTDSQIQSHLEEVISKRVQEMMGDFTARLIPEMTRQIVSLTMERVEKAVRDLVPDLAEKAIQEEIKKLQKEDKD